MFVPRLVTQQIKPRFQVLASPYRILFGLFVERWGCLPEPHLLVQSLHIVCLENIPQFYEQRFCADSHCCHLFCLNILVIRQRTLIDIDVDGQYRTTGEQYRCASQDRYIM